MKPVTHGDLAHPDVAVSEGARADGRSSRWDEHRRRRHRELLRTVRRVIAAHGSDISMDQISTLSGTSKTVLYRYFGDRAGLQRAMGEWAMAIIERSLSQASVPDGRPAGSRAALHAMIAAFTELADRSPHVYRFCDPAVVAETGHPAAGFFGSVTALLCERMGLSRESEVLWAYGAVGFVRSCTERWLADPRDRAAFDARLADWLWASSRALRPEDAEAEEPP